MAKAKPESPDSLDTDLAALNTGIIDLQTKHNLVLLAEPFIDSEGRTRAKLTAIRPQPKQDDKATNTATE